MHHSLSIQLSKTCLTNTQRLIYQREVLIWLYNVIIIGFVPLKMFWVLFVDLFCLICNMARWTVEEDGWTGEAMVVVTIHIWGIHVFHLVRYLVRFVGFFFIVQILLEVIICYCIFDTDSGEWLYFNHFHFLFVVVYLSRLKRRWAMVRKLGGKWVKECFNTKTSLPYYLVIPCYLPYYLAIQEKALL